MANDSDHMQASGLLFDEINRRVADAIGQVQKGAIRGQRSAPSYHRF